MHKGFIEMVGFHNRQKRDWLQMPDEIMGAMILQRLDPIEILLSIQKVCRNWGRICKDPAMWKVIDFDYYSSISNTKNDFGYSSYISYPKNDFDYYSYISYTKNYFEKLCKQAVHRSCGELIHIRLRGFGTDDLLDHISRCSSKLNCLRLTSCYDITVRGLSNALKRLPHLETIQLYYFDFRKKEDIEVIGRSCPLLKSFKMWTMMSAGDVYAHAVAKSMPALRHLKLIGIMDDDGVRAILNGCPHLESLHLCRCPSQYRDLDLDLDLDKNLEKLCRERIKDFKYSNL
ncbi:hypothetical protein OSB04_002002 [Centaurea solstitialis]|uniref:F-box domain-containing protein n=1 Tax=Centaurea solstitialis TaxID=347529 RepID=A0AA38U2M6_9ASTR|nr:hypothetical protein OSB04_002002 [Centaurea solstitialis]